LVKTRLKHLLAVAAGSLQHQVVMNLFIGTNVTLGSYNMLAFILGIKNAFLVSTFLYLVGAGFSFVRGKENRRQQATEAVGSERPDLRALQSFLLGRTWRSL
jgi:hypothetical protein